MINDNYNTTNPLVSICIPIYNGETYLEEALQSANNQDYPNLEIIISDDCSKDKSLAIVENFTSNIPITILHHTPLGIGSNWNNCVEHAAGTYIKFLFQDDILAPRCISELVKAAERDPKIGLSFCKREILYNPNNEPHVAWLNTYKNPHLSWPQLNAIQEGAALLKAPNLLLSPKNKVGEPTCVLLKKEVFETVGYFNTSLKQCLDYEYWHRVFKQYKVAFVDQELATFRRHDEQATSINEKNNLTERAYYEQLLYSEFFSFLHIRVKIKLLLRTSPLRLFINKLFKSMFN